MAVFDMFANMGLFAGDVFAAIGLLGALIMLVFAAGDRRFGRAPERVAVWAWGGTLLGVLFFASIWISGMPVTKIGFLFGWTPSMVGGMLAVAVAVLGLSTALRVARRR